MSIMKIMIVLSSFTMIGDGVSTTALDQSADKSRNSDNVQGTKSLEYSLDLCWCSLFLYTLVVAYIAYYIGRILTNEHNKFEAELSSSFTTKLFQTRNRFKCILISKLIHNQQDGLKRFRDMLKRTESELQGISVPKYELQKHRLADAILNGYIFPWYDTISDDQAFPMCSRQILLSAFTQLGKKLEQVDRIALAKEVILLLHCHWTEYCRALEKDTESDDGGRDQIVHDFKAIHPYFRDSVEVGKQYQALVSMLLKDVMVPELQSDLFCEFLSGILVKGCIFYYANLICNQKWLNSTLISLVTLTQTRNNGKLNAEFTHSISSNSVTPELEGRPKSANAVLENVSVGSNQENATFDYKQQSSDSKILLTELHDESDDKCQLSVQAVQGGTDLPAPSLSKDEPRAGVHSQNNDQPIISSVLSGLLSTAAMPLLPDGSRYELCSVDHQEPIQNLWSSTLDKSPSTIPLSLSPTKGLTQEVEKIHNVVSSSGAKVNVSNKTRHSSVKETSRRQQHVAQNCLEKMTQSLDDNRLRPKVISQDEINTAGDLTDEHDQNIKQSSSPICEGTEDFAATIAKLRSLLEQKQSRSNLIELDPSATDACSTQTEDVSGDLIKFGGNENSEEDSTKLSPKEDSEGSGGTTDGSTGSLISPKLDVIEDDLEDNESELRHIFLNVLIPKTETIGADCSAQSILFCIQYEGVYVEDGGNEINQGLVLRTTTVKRRFKEFLTLQNQLEENPLWKPHLKQIKTPTKWLTLSFPNLNSISHKKSFLEKYLQQICYHPILGFSKELRQFMAYGDDGFQAFEILTSSSLSFHRLDKLAKTFTGVFHSLKDVLPSFETETVQSPTTPTTTEDDREKFSPTDPKAKKMFASFFNFGEKITAHKTRNQEAVMEGVKTSKIPLEKPNEDSGCSDDPAAELDILKSIYSELEDKTSLPNKEETDAEIIIDGNLDGMYPLASVFTQLLCDVLWLPPQRPHVASIAAFMSISGKSLENYLQETLSLLLSEDAITTYLEWLTCYINDWMVETSSSWPRNEELPDCTQTDLKNCLRQKIPAWGRWMWGRKRLDITIDRLSGFCQHPELNHDFALSLMELIFSKIIDYSNEINDNVIPSEEDK